jgi:predicted secreted protein
MTTIVASLTGAPQRWRRAAVPLLDVQQPALEARRHRFRAVGNFELQENSGDVLLDRIVKC